MLEQSSRRVRHPALNPRYLWNSVRFLHGLWRGAYFDCEVLLGYRCNLHCDFCTLWRQAPLPQPTLSADDYRRIAAKLARVGTMIVSLEGGEPLLRSDLEAIVAAFARNHRPLVYTNGWDMTPRRARDLFAAGLWQAAVSLDYATPRRHDQHRGTVGTHARAVAALEMLRDAAPRRGKQAHAFTVLMDDNLEELPELLELTRTLKVGHQVTLISTRGFGRAAAPHALPRPGVGRRVAELRCRYRHLATFPSYLEQIDCWLAAAPVAACRAGLQGFAIDPCGRVSPCNDRLTVVVGDLLHEEWSDIRARLQELAARRDCNQCYTLCRGVGHALGGRLGLRRLHRLLSDFVVSPC